MIKKHFFYEMDLLFDTSVRNHSWTLKCIPQSDLRQEILSLSVTVEPDCMQSDSVDSFGNVILYGRADIPHERFSVRVDGVVDTGKGFYGAVATESEKIRYRNDSGMTKPGPAVCALYDTISFADADSVNEKAERIREAVYRALSYEKGRTTTETTAEQACALGAGVCQDYAHLMIALCRMAHIPARYVTGLMEGEGESHAWVEVCIDDIWVGMDPTNNCMVYDWYVTIAHGRDSKDCVMNRGRFYGITKQSQRVRSVVEDCAE